MKKRVLVVEDNDDVREMMSLLVEMNGYEALEARDGLEAVEVASKFCPDLILMDIGLPKLDGIAATSRIKGYSQCSKTPVVAVTAFQDIKAEAIEAGCQEVINKPVEPSRIKKILESHLLEADS